MSAAVYGYYSYTHYYVGEDGSTKNVRRLVYYYTPATYAYSYAYKTGGGKTAYHYAYKTGGGATAYSYKYDSGGGVTTYGYKYGSGGRVTSYGYRYNTEYRYA